ncbi:MAG: hypothetical protein AAB631_01910 [Patescibacteria group bacterium]
MKNRGIVSLATVLVITLFLLSVSILMGIQSGTSVFTGFSERTAEVAQALAETGIQDATLKLARNKDYAGSYTLTESDGSTTDISVTQGNPVVVVATSTVAKPLGTIKRSLRASITIDSNGVITTISKNNQ